MVSAAVKIVMVSWRTFSFRWTSNPVIDDHLSMKPWAHPGAINTDKAPAYRSTITELKVEGKCAPDTVHRQIKYLNNITEADHGKLKCLINPVRGFKSMKTACATIKDFDLIRVFKKGQLDGLSLFCNRA